MGGLHFPSVRVTGRRTYCRSVTADGSRNPRGPPATDRNPEGLGGRGCSAWGDGASWSRTSASQAYRSRRRG